MAEQTTGSLVNHLMSRSTTIVPEVGMGATLLGWTDRHAATVVRVSASKKTFWLQQDRAIRTDKNGMSECQEYTFERQPNAQARKVVMTKKGWREAGGGYMVALGVREEYHDFSF